MQTKNRQSCPVDGAGSGVEVGGDALESSRARLSPSPWPAGEVGDLTLDDGTVGPVPGLPGGIGLFFAGSLQDGLAGVDRDRAPVARCRASLPHRAVRAVGLEARLSSAAHRHGDGNDVVGRAGDGQFLCVDDEEVL